MSVWPSDHLVVNGDHSLVATADVLLVVEDGQFPAHSQILSLKSPFFRGMFESLKVGGSKEKTNVAMEGSIGGKVLSRMLKLVYDDEEEVKDAAEVLAMLQLADKYSFPCLHKKCEKKLDTGLGLLHCGGYPVGNLLTSQHTVRARSCPMEAGDHHDAVRWLPIAHRYGFIALGAKCFAVILKFMSSQMDHKREAIVRAEFGKQKVDPRVMFDLVRFAMQVYGIPGLCLCGEKVPNGERICFDCALVIVHGDALHMPQYGAQDKG